MTKFKSGFSFLVLLMIACIQLSCRETGRLTRRYSTINPTPDSGELKLLGDVQIKGFVFDIDSPKSETKLAKNVFTLSDHGQEAYVEALSSKEKKSADLQAQLIKSLEKKPDPKIDIVKNNKFVKRIVFSVINSSKLEADRITQLTITIPLKVTDNIRITSFSKLATEYQTINLGSESLTNSLSGSLTAGYGITGTQTGTTTNTDYGSSTNSSGVSSTNGTTSTPNVGISATAAASRAVTDQINLSQRYISLTGYVTTNSLVISEQSVSGVNLTGNIIVDVGFEFGSLKSDVVYEFEEYFNKNAIVAPDSMSISERYIVDPSLQNDLKLMYACNVNIRHVRDFQRTVPEVDDDIVNISGAVSVGDSLVMLSNERNKTDLWKIRDVTKKNDLLLCDSLLDTKGELFFDSRYQATTFLKWFKTYYKKSVLICTLGRMTSLGINLNNYSLMSSDNMQCLKEFAKGAIVVAK